jgi:hypothetical protein
LDILTAQAEIADPQNAKIAIENILKVGEKVSNQAYGNKLHLSALNDCPRLTPEDRNKPFC